MLRLFSRRRKLKVPVPPKPFVLLQSPREAYHQRRPHPRNDNALATVFRIYWAIVLDDAITMRNEIEYFWSRHEWSVSDIPDPKDPEPDRYAIVAAVPYILVAAFNNLINRGLPRDAPGIMVSEDLDSMKERRPKPEKVPKWAEDAPRLEEALVLPNKDGDVRESFADETADELLAKKGVLCQRLHIYFV